jgi:hypothetical protein
VSGVSSGGRGSVGDRARRSQAQERRATHHLSLFLFRPAAKLLHLPAKFASTIPLPSNSSRSQMRPVHAHRLDPVASPLEAPWATRCSNPAFPSPARRLCRAEQATDCATWALSCASRPLPRAADAPPLPCTGAKAPAMDVCSREEEAGWRLGMDPTGGVHLSAGEREGQVGTTWLRGARGEVARGKTVISHAGRVSWRATSSKVAK